MEWERRLSRERLPGHSPRVEPVREIHSYDLDYGWRTGGPFEYSGRAGYSEPYPAPAPPSRPRRPPYLPPPDYDHWPRGVFEPRVTDRRRRPLWSDYGREYWLRRGRYDEDYDAEYYAEVPPWPEGRRLRRH